MNVDWLGMYVAGFLGVSFVLIFCWDRIVATSKAGPVFLALVTFPILAFGWPFFVLSFWWWIWRSRGTTQNR